MVTRPKNAIFIRAGLWHLSALACLEKAFKVNCHQNTHLEDYAEQRRELLLKCIEACLGRSRFGSGDQYAATQHRLVMFLVYKILKSFKYFQYLKTGKPCRQSTWSDEQQPHPRTVWWHGTLQQDSLQQLGPRQQRCGRFSQRQQKQETCAILPKYRLTHYIYLLDFKTFIS